MFGDPVPFRSLRRGGRPAVEGRSLHVDPHAGDVAPVRIRSDGISIERGVARDEEVLLPKVQNFGEKAKRGARFGQVGVVVNPRAHDSLDPARAQRTGEPRRGVGVPAAVQAPDGEHGHDDAVPSARSHRTPAPVALTLGRFRVQRGPLAVHGLELLEPADPPALPRGRIVV